MTPQQAYRRNTQSGWSRIEMLLAIYDAAIHSMDAGIDALNQHDSAAIALQQLESSKLLLLIISGIENDGDQVASRIRELCIFCIEQVGTREVSAWMGARTVLSTLREGFQGIREEGIQLEADGVIEHLQAGKSQTLLHV